MSRVLTQGRRLAPPVPLRPSLHGRVRRAVDEALVRWRFMERHGLTDVSAPRFVAHEARRRIARRALMPRQAKRKIFGSADVETFAFCNRSCSFCPVNNDRFEPREVGRMDVKIWQKIVDDLASFRFAGRLSPFLYGEPLMDKRLADFITYARARCPYAVIQVNTNGDFLDERTMKRFIKAGIDLFYVTDYEPNPQPHLQELREQYPYWMSLRHGLSAVTNRAGMLFDIKNKRADDPCFRPSGQLIVNWKGDVLLCCQDFYGQSVFGNVRDRSILDIWHSAELNAVRGVLEKPGGRQKFDMCKGCDA